MEKHREILERDVAAVLRIIKDAAKEAFWREVGVWLDALKKVAFEGTDFFDELKY
uniref:Rx N-terminal domain-containing protein n=1 Tax=Aegilops tauschii TaxID=37682 RepID=M8B1E5_AEGTA